MKGRKTPPGRRPTPSRRSPANLGARSVNTRRSHLILIGALLAAIVGAALLVVPGSPSHKKARLGLDLQGGLEVVLKAQPAANVKLQQTDLDRSVSIMRDRIDKLGVSEPEIRKQGTDQIVIELPGVK